MCAQHAPLLLLRKSCAQATVFHLMVVSTLRLLSSVRASIACRSNSGVMVFEAQAPRVLQARSSNPIAQRGQARLGHACVVKPRAFFHMCVKSLHSGGEVQCSSAPLLANTTASSFPFQCIQPSWLLCWSGSATWTATLLMLSWQSVWAKFVAILRHAPAVLPPGRLRLGTSKLRSIDHWQLLGGVS